MTDQSMTCVLDGALVSPPPIWLMRQAGRYLPEYRKIRQEAGSFLDLCYNPDLAAEVTMQPIRRFDLDAAILFSDILVIPDGLGIPVRFEEGRGPILDPVRDHEAVKRLDTEAVRSRCAPVYEAVAKIRAGLSNTKTLIGFAGGPWTVAAYAVEGGSSKGFGEIKAWMWRDPPGFRALIDVLVEATIEHLSRQVEAGADCVQLFESWAGVLPEPEFQCYVVDPTRRIVDGLRFRHANLPIIGFPRAAGHMIETYVSETKVSAVGLDTGVPMAQALALQRKLPIQGNLDPLLLVSGGTALRQRVEDLIGILASGPFIFNLGHGIVPQTPPDHVAALITMVRETAQVSSG
ncbi:MAG: uroporphyrinogen decarboxylase [Rhodospirillaceae bacterium]|nr:uroporphyrinogen decarboxylase [Rhodospirillaceae bacterium]MCY4238700.1 uroporphyrinogen decarboxylase [Rhodospirillaceae bacterium]MCY4312040.1 uroporphyrinogen decarboxylase [Rhodospirillaceae bacterium]